MQLGYELVGPETYIYATKTYYWVVYQVLDDGSMFETKNFYRANTSDLSHPIFFKRETNNNMFPSKEEIEKLREVIKEAEILLGEIMRDEVNAQDEAEKWLREYGDPTYNIAKGTKTKGACLSLERGS